MPANDKEAILGVCIALPVLAILAVILRFESRRLSQVSLWWDDWAIAAAVLLNTGLAVAVLICSRVGGLGGHEEYLYGGLPVDLNAAAVFAKTIYAFDVTCFPILGTTKLAVLLFYARVFIDRNFRRIVAAGCIIVVLWSIAFGLAIAFPCSPVAARWDITITDFTCIDGYKFLNAAAVTDVIIDGLILSLPIRPVLRLQMPLARKVGVIFIFLLGSLVTVTGVVRLYYVRDIYKPTGGSHPDKDYDYARAVYWQVIESSTGIVSACLPTLRPVYHGHGLDALVSNILSAMHVGSPSETESQPDFVIQIEAGKGAHVSTDQMYV